LHCKPKSAKPPNGHTLWLGDLTLDTTEQDVIDLFEPCGRIEMICLKVNQLRNGHFGHVKFYETESVDKATQLAGTLLNGVPLRMDYAEDKPISAYRHSKDQPVPDSNRAEDCRTIFVGGLPGDVSEEMIHSLFETCGEIKEVRLDRSKRSGAQFCHVEFFECPAVDRAIRLSGERLGNSKIRVDFAENRKHDPGSKKQHGAIVLSQGMPPAAGSYGPPDGGYLGPPLATWPGPGTGVRTPQHPPDMLRGLPPSDWAGPCPCPGRVPQHWPGGVPFAAPPPGYVGWQAPSLYRFPPPPTLLGPADSAPYMTGYPYCNRPPGPECSGWQHPAYGMSHAGIHDAWRPGMHPSQRERSASLGSSYSGSYSYSYSYTPSPSHSPSRKMPTIEM